MADAYRIDDGSAIPFTAAAACAAGDLVQLPDGRAGVVVAAVAAGALGSAYVTGRFAVAKVSGVVLLDGGRVYWDHSAGNATFRPSQDRDYYIGRAVGDAASTATVCSVALNVDPRPDRDLLADPYVTAPTGTQALGGFLPPQRCGGALKFILSATNEAQKADALGKDGFDPDANAIVEAVFAVVSDGGAGAQDVSIGLANATHATDADSITESLFVHLNGGDVNVYAESDDGTTEVAATDTTIDYTEGAANRVEVWFDLRDLADVGVYVNGAAVLTGTTFKLDAATGPLKLLVHVEKTATTDTYELDVERLEARFAEQ